MLDFDGTHITLEHDLGRWLWWEPSQTPRGGDPRASRRTRVAWDDVVALDATGPYLEVALRYHTDEGVHVVHARPRESRVWTARVETLFRYARTQLEPSRVRGGWVDAPDIAWEPSTRWPDESDVVHASPYRSNDDAGARVRAIREAPSPLEAMMQWLASTPERPWKSHPRCVVVTRDHVFVERRDRTKVRVERAAMRGRRRTEAGDRAYYYGRKLELLLPLRDEPCPVVWALDEDHLTMVGGDD